VKRQVRLLRRAVSDLEEILRYMERDRPAAAERLLTRLLDVAASRSDDPERGARPRDERLQRLGFRFVIVAPYLLIYKVGPQTVRVYRVVQGHRRYQGLL
jgi:plasmid stabilization system protein ParE